MQYAIPTCLWACCCLSIKSNAEGAERAPASGVDLFKSRHNSAESSRGFDMLEVCCRGSEDDSTRPGCNRFC